MKSPILHSHKKILLKFILFLFKIPWFILPFISCLITFIFYRDSLSYSFQFDDVANISKHFAIRHATLKNLFFSGSRWISFWINSLNYAIGKFNPYWFRLTNLCFHLATGILVFFIVLLALKHLRNTAWYKMRYVVAYVTSLLFLLHPVQTQTVSYVIQGRLEGLAGLTTMALGFIFLLYSHLKNPILHALLIPSMFIIMFLATGTKEITIITPLLIMLIDWFFVARGDVSSLANRWYIHAGLWMITIGMYFYLLKPHFFSTILQLKMEAPNNIGNILTQNQSDTVKAVPFFISQFKVILHYIMIFFWPFSMSVEYDWKLCSSFFAPDCILPLCLLISLGFLIAYILRNNVISPWSFGLLWFFLGLAPRSTIVPSSELLADYKTYLPSFGLLFVIALASTWCIQYIFEKKDKFKAHSFISIYFSCSCAAFLLGYITHERNTVWRSCAEFWTNIIKNAPGKARAYNNLGVAISESGKIADAIALYKKAIVMDPYYPDPRNNLAVAYSVTGKLDLAIDTMKGLLRIYKHYPEGYNNLASFYIAKKDFDNAEKILNAALQLKPHYGKALFNLGKINLERKNTKAALEYFRKACTQADLDTEAGYAVYGQTALNLRQFDEALFAYKKITELNPSFENYLKLGTIYTLCGNHTEALQLYDKLAQSNPNDPRFLLNIGECNMHLARYDIALKYFEEAKKSISNMPQLDIKIAACLEELGYYEKARIILMKKVQEESTPEHIRAMANQGLAHLIQKDILKS